MTAPTKPSATRPRSERLQALRDRSRQVREELVRRERRRGMLWRGGLVAAGVAVATVIAVVIAGSARPAGPGPAAMEDGGFLLTAASTEALTAASAEASAPPAEAVAGTPTPSAASPAGPAPTEPTSGAHEPAEANPATPDPAGPNPTTGTATSGSPSPAASPTPTETPGPEPVRVTLYVDYLCDECRQFERANADYLGALLESGAATVDLHPIAMLDRLSQGTRYSTRAANLAACVADAAPPLFDDVSALLLARQPREGSGGLTDEELLDIAASAGVTLTDGFEHCVRDRAYSVWVDAQTSLALAVPIPGTDGVRVTEPLTVIVDGLPYTGSPEDAAAFAAFVVTTASIPSATSPTPSATPSR